MSKTKDVSCPVDASLISYGEYANAFRVMQDGPDAVLDFCVYSEQDNRARVVSRVRVTPSFLKVILSRLHASIDHPVGNGSLYVMPEVQGIN
jgi:hypothetical protein